MKNFNLVPKITLAIVLVISLAQGSCVEDTEPTQTSPRTRAVPAQRENVEPLPTPRNPDRSRPRDGRPATRQIGD